MLEFNRLYKSYGTSNVFGYSIFFSISNTTGNLFREFFSCNKSLADAAPSATLPVNLSISYTPSSASLRSLFKINSLINFSTISSLLLISVSFINGF